MICKKCGIETSGNFCNGCGAEIAPNKSKTSKADLYALCVVVGVAVSSVCFLIANMLKLNNGTTIGMELSAMFSIGCVLVYSGITFIVVSNSNKRNAKNACSQPQPTNDKSNDNVIQVTREDQKLKIIVLLIGTFVIFGLFITVIFANAGKPQPNIPIEQNSTVQSVPKEQQQTSDVHSEPTSILTETMGQKNAREKALTYLSYSAFSYSGLVKQLEFEKYSNEDATYAVDNCGADWNEQAVKSAEQYLEYSSFSRDSLISQLEFSGFTNEQAVYAVDKIGY